MEAYFSAPAFEALDETDKTFETALAVDAAFCSWSKQNLAEHRQSGYAIATVSLKAIGEVPGDATADQMRLIADIAEQFGHDELRISHEQNIVLPHVRKRDLPAVLDIYKAVPINSLDPALRLPRTCFAELGNARHKG